MCVCVCGCVRVDLYFARVWGTHRYIQRFAMDTCIHIYSRMTYIYIHMHGICVYTCMYIYTQIYACVNIHIYMYTHIHIYIHVYTYMYIYIHVYTYTYIYMSHTHLTGVVSLTSRTHHTSEIQNQHNPRFTTQLHLAPRPSSIINVSVFTLHFLF